MTYHLFETEFKSIASLNGEAIRYFSFGAFSASIFMNIVVSYTFSSSPISESGTLLLKFGSLLTGGLMLLFYVLGAWAIWTKKSIVDDIKRETVERVPSRND